MTIASAYTLEDILKMMDEAYAALVDKEPEKYEKNLGSAREELEGLLDRYPGDEELKGYLADFASFLKKREEGMSRSDEKKRLSALISDLRHKIHWRKLGMSSGKDLPFKDYRSLRGEVGRRGL
jgi:hypothetical protein